MRRALWLLLLPSALARAELGPSDKLWYASFQGFAAYTYSTVPSGGQVPTLLEFGLGAAGSLRVSGQFFLGLDTEFWADNQYAPSPIDKLVGNRRGWRWSIVSPSAMYRLDKIDLRLDFQFLGDWVFLNHTTNDEELHMSSPIGLRLSADYLLPYYSVRVGLFIEWLEYAHQTTPTTDQFLLPRLQTLSGGVAAVYSL